LRKFFYFKEYQNDISRYQYSTYYIYFHSNIPTTVKKRFSYKINLAEKKYRYIGF